MLHEYYTNELASLRDGASHFAKAHPKAAAQLDIGRHESKDPHTEKMIESFAYLSARLHCAIDESQTKSASALLEVMAPHLITRMPAMTVVQMKLAKTSKVVSSHIPKGTIIHAIDGQTHSRFQTVYGVNDFGYSLLQAHLVNHPFKTTDKQKFIRMKMEVTPNQNLGDDLTFHLYSADRFAHLIYESMFSQKNPFVYMNVDNEVTYHHLGMDALCHTGFEDIDSSLPQSHIRSHAHALMQEFFHLPEKFLFFKVKGLAQHLKTKEASPGQDANTPITFNLYISIHESSPQELKKLNTAHFRLHCTPIINLFSKLTDPLRITHKSAQYPLVADHRNEGSFEIFSVDKVMATDERTNETVAMPCYYASTHYDSSAKTYWYMNRSTAATKAFEGSHITLSFVDLDLNLDLPTSRIVYAHTHCTNRDLPAKLSSLTQFSIHDAPISPDISMIYPIAMQKATDFTQHSLWRLASTLNTSCGWGGDDPDQNATTFKEMLTLLATTTAMGPTAAALITNISSIEVKPIMRRISKTSQHFVQGLEVTLCLNAQPFNGDSHFLFAKLLSQYMHYDAPMNSFVEFVLTTPTQEGDWMRWKPSAGKQTSL